MRKDRKTTTAAPEIARIQGYHQRTDWTRNYATDGFKANKYFTSDRAIILDDNFNRPDGRPLKGYGLEIETECNSINDQRVYADVLDKIIFPLFPADLFKMQNDSSLHGRSNAECITQVMTREFIRNNYRAFQTMYNHYFPAFGVSCSASGNCGMHVNISNALFGTDEKSQQIAIKKLLYILNRHFVLCCRLFARDPRRTHYCGVMNDYLTVEQCKKANLFDMPSDHYQSFNASHYPEGRVEIRLVSGQKNFGQFRNTMESVFHLVEAVKRLSWADCDNVIEIFRGCNQYVYDRLSTLCVESFAAHELAEIAQTIVNADLI